MKIISPFKDYYDSAVFHGNDPHLLYMRKPEVVENNLCVYWPQIIPEMEKPSWMRKYKEGPLPKYHLIYGFAGRIFMLDFKVSGSYANEKIDAVAPSELTDKYDNKSLQNLFIAYGPSWTEYHTANTELPNFKNAYSRNTFNLYNGVWYRNYKRLIVKNASMQFCYLQHLMSPAEAYIEMERWLSNQARPEKPIPQMENSVKIHQHGFDKHSFRNSKRKD